MTWHNVTKVTSTIIPWIALFVLSFTNISGTRLLVFMLSWFALLTVSVTSSFILEYHHRDRSM